MNMLLNDQDDGRRSFVDRIPGRGLALLIISAACGCATPFSHFATPWATLPVELADVRATSQTQLCNFRPIEGQGVVVTSDESVERPILPDPFLDTGSVSLPPMRFTEED